MPTNPTDHLKEIQDSLKNLPERLALVLNRKGTEKRQPKALNKEGIKPTEEKLPDKWQSSERFLSAAGSFAPGLGKAGALLRNIRELGESWEQLQKSFSGTKIPKPVSHLDRRLNELKTEGISSQPREAKTNPEKIERPVNAPAPIDTSKGVFVGGQKLGQAEIDSLVRALEKNTEALAKNDPDPTEDSEEKQTQEKQLPVHREIPYTEGVESPKVQTRRIKGPFRPPKEVPSSKESEGFWGKVGSAIAELFA